MKLTWTQVQWWASLGVLFSASWWWRVFWLKSLPLPPFLMIDTLHFYHFGYFPLVVLVCGAWLLGGARGWEKLLSWRGIWLWLLWQFALWGRITFGKDTLNLEAAIGESTEFFWVVAFVTVLIANPPPLRWVWWALLGGMAFQVLLGFAQTLNQAEIGLAYLSAPLGLKEFDLDTGRSGISVVGAGRFLRPYGVGAHPNLTVGAVVIGFLMGLAVFPRHASLTLLGWWGILLSFSRAALGGTLLGIILILGWRGLTSRRIKPQAHLLASLVGVALLFTALYPHLVLGRLGATPRQTPTFETFSAASRAVYIEQALGLMPQHLWRGVGRGNFAWHSAYLLYCCDDRDLRGDSVHNIYLLAGVEVGLVGLAWFGLLMVGNGLYFLRQAPHLDPIQVGAFAGGVAWLGIGWFDHYPWTQFGHQILFWSCWALLWLKD